MKTLDSGDAGLIKANCPICTEPMLVEDLVDKVTSICPYCESEVIPKVEIKEKDIVYTPKEIANWTIYLWIAQWIGVGIILVVLIADGPLFLIFKGLGVIGMAQYWLKNLREKGRL